MDGLDQADNDDTAVQTEPKRVAVQDAATMPICSLLHATECRES